MNKAIEILILIVLIGFPFIVKLNTEKTTAQQSHRLEIGYIKYSLFIFGILLLFFILDRRIYNKPDFIQLGKGILINDDIFFYTILFVIAPLIVSLIPFKRIQQTDISTAKELFGEDVNNLPKNFRDFFLFFFYTVITVVFEELFFRQFLFYSLNKTFHLQGDILVMISSVLFTISHDYKKIIQLLFIFALGLVLGKVYQHTESIFYPMALHLCLNLSQVVLVFKRIGKLRKSDPNDYPNTHQPNT
ncbi:MAG: type II CAAX endopeptidase family protein [Sediminibacterium sp.]|nr:type II CAAX endopeptidase family protein [Sediminibacterium sp.]